MNNFALPFKSFQLKNHYRKRLNLSLSTLIFGFFLLLRCSTQMVLAQNYTISAPILGTTITITDGSGNGETIQVSQVGGNMRFYVAGRTYSLNGGPTTPFDVTPADASLAGRTSITINAGAGNDIVNIGSFAFSLPNLTVNGGTGNDNINFNGNIIFAANSNLNVDLQNDDPAPGVDNISLTAGADLILSGTGAADFKASRSINFSANSILRTANGNLTLEANWQTTPTTGTFTGLNFSGINGLVECTGTGALTVKGKGGTSGNDQAGVYLQAGCIIRGGTATGNVLVEGTGGASSGSRNNGVWLEGTGAKITSIGSPVSILGQGSGTGTSGENMGVRIIFGGEISSGGSGNLTVQGTAAQLPTGNFNYGVYLTSGTISTVTGNITVTGQAGGAGVSSNNTGVILISGSVISAGGSGTVLVNGTGGNSSGGANDGIHVLNASSAITSAGGNVTLVGNGGGSGISNFNMGVDMTDGGTVSAGGMGNVSVTGTGGIGAGTDLGVGGSHFGVFIGGVGTSIFSNGGNVSVIGQGGGTTMGARNVGVQLENGGNISSGGSGNLSISGTGKNISGFNNYGFAANTGTTINSGGVTNITGFGGGSGSTGIQGIVISGNISTTGSGTLTLNGTGDANSGGVSIFGSISSAGNISISGKPTWSGSSAFSLASTGSVTTTGANRTITIIGNSVNINASSTLTTTSTGSVTFIPLTVGYPIELGGSDGSAIGLTDTELDRIISPTAAILIGNSSSGNMNISASITRSYASNVFIFGQPINPNFSGVDINTLGASLVIGAGSTLNIDIDGKTVNTQYRQLAVNGIVDLNGSGLSFNGSSYAPAGGETFTIVNNDGTDPIVGTFSGLPEGATIPNFLGSPLSATISYVGGTGNDVVLTVASPDYTINGTTSLVVTDVSGNGETLTMSENGANIRFTNSNTTRTYSINGAAATTFTTPADVTLTGKTSITINAGGGNDIINIGGFTASFPNLVVNGGTGNDIVNFTGNITFNNNASLNCDLQNDDFVVGEDNINISNGADLIFSGTGTVDMKVSRSITFSANSLIRTVNGPIILISNQQTIPTAGNFAGINMNVSNALVECVGTGIITVTGKGGNSGFENAGVLIGSGSAIMGGTSGSLQITGYGGQSTSLGCYGVWIKDNNSRASSLGGNVFVSGIGGGTGTVVDNSGVRVSNGGLVSSGGTGAVTINGTGGTNSTGNFNYGVIVDGANSQVTSSGGNVGVTGVGGGNAASAGNIGVLVDNAGQISAGGSGTVAVSGTGGSTTGNGNSGVTVEFTGSFITSSGGNVSVTGIGGGSGASGNNHGISIENDGEISAGGSGTLTINGTGGNTAATSNHGIVMDALLSTSISAQGNITLTAIAPLSTTAFSTAANSTISCTGVGSTINILANTMGIGGTISTSASGSVILRPSTNGNGINLGGADVANTTLGLTDLELNRIISPTPLITIGNASTGAISFSGSITRPYNTNLNLLTGTGVSPDFAGTDVDLSGGTLTLGTAQNFIADIDGTTVNTQYKQLDVNGSINLNAASLQFTGSSYAPVGGETFTIVNNDGADAIVGTFAGLPQGATISNFLGSALSATISYVGGTGNDVVISVSPVNYTITTAGNNLIITDQSGNGETLTISQNGTNIRFEAPVSRTYSINGGPAIGFSTPADIALAGLNSITANAAGGNDIIVVNPFSANLPNFTLNGGQGNDNVFLNGKITFANNANLNVDLQDDDLNPGTDNIIIDNGADLILSGNGICTMRCSRSLSFSDNSLVRTVNGNLILEANQQAIPTAGNFIGVSLNVSNALAECTGFGSLQVRGRGGNSGSGNQGIRIQSGSILRGGTSNSAIVEGQGGASSGNGNYGIWILQSGSKITTNGAYLSVKGQGGGTGASTQNLGLFVDANAEISTPGVGNLMIDGTGGTTTGGGNVGVFLIGASISTVNGNMTILGQGGGSGASAGNVGISVGNNGTITVSGSGSLDMNGKGGLTNGNNNHGISISGSGAQISAINSSFPTSIQSESGGVGSSANNISLLISLGAKITTGPGGLLLEGFATSSSSSNIGVSIKDPATEVVSGSTIIIRADAQLSTQSFFMGTGATISALVTPSNIEINTNTAQIEAGSSIASSATGTVFIRQYSDGRAIHLGGADVVNSSLGLTNAELNCIVAPTPTIQIGNQNTGILTIENGISRTYATNFTLFGSNIRPNFNSSDIDANGGLVTIGTRKTLQIVVNGPVANTQYRQLRVNRINLNGATLSFAGSSYIPVGGEAFIIVDNEGINPFSGTFAGLPEGSVIPNFLGSTLGGTISYVGGTGNDVVITVEIPVGNALVWNGSQGDGVWNNPLNWTPNFTAPTSVSNVTIPGGVPQPNISSNLPPAVCANLTLTGNANPVINSGFQLAVSGHITGSNSNWIGGGGKVVLSGVSQQNINGHVRMSSVDFANTSIDGVVIVSNASLKLEPGAVANFLANSKLTNNGKLILSSNATATAKIGPIPTSASITGEFTQERYLPYGPGVGGWYFIGSPFGGKNFTELANDFVVTGLTSGFGAQGGGIFPSVEPERSTVFKYVEALHNVRTDTVQKIGWRIPGNENMIPGMGYRVWVKYYNNPSHKFDVRGSLTRGTGVDNDFTFPTLTRNEFAPCYPTNSTVNPLNCNEEQRGWNLIANPFPGDIDWDAPGGWTKPAEMNNAFYTWNSALGGYRAYIGSGGVDLGVTLSVNANPSIIPSGQSFFVRLSSPGTYTSELKVKESAKSTAMSGTFTRSATANNGQIRIRLEKPENAGYRFDGMIRFREESTDGFDQHLDLVRFPGSGFEFSLKGEGGQFLLNTIAPPTETKTIPLTIHYQGESGTFRLKFLDVESLENNMMVYLKDNVLQTITPIQNQTNYEFQAFSGSLAMADRFELIINPMDLTEISSPVSSKGMLVYPNPVVDHKLTVLVSEKLAESTLEITDILGRKVPFVSRKLDASSMEIAFPPSLAMGQYFLKMTSPEGTFIKTILVR